MADVAGVQNNIAKEQEYKRHVFDMRRIQEKNQKDYKDVTVKGETALTDISKEYDKKIAAEKTDLDNKLTEIRNGYSERIKKENERYDEELENLRKAHAEQVSEVKENNQKEIAGLQKSQQNFIESSKTKMTKEKLKQTA